MSTEVEDHVDVPLTAEELELILAGLEQLRTTSERKSHARGHVYAPWHRLSVRAEELYGSLYMVWQRALRGEG